MRNHLDHPQTKPQTKPPREGTLDATGLRLAVIVGRFNRLITQPLLEGATECFYRHQGQPEQLEVFWVPGAFEIPLMAQKLLSLNWPRKTATRKATGQEPAESGGYDALVALGAVIRGETPHFEYISSAVASGLAQVSLEGDVPIAFGVLTTDNVEQALDRAGAKAGNKGEEAMLTAIEMANLLKTIC